MHSAPLLKVSANNHTQLRERLKEQFALADDDQALIDTLEGISNFADLCLEAAREAKRREAMATAMDSVIADNKVRKERHERAAASLREIIKNAMSDAGEKQIKSADMTLSMRSGKRKLIIDKERVPHSYCMQVVSFVPDREKIEAAIGEGDVPPGVEISNGEPSLAINIK